MHNEVAKPIAQSENHIKSTRRAGGENYRSSRRRLQKAGVQRTGRRGAQTLVKAFSDAARLLDQALSAETRAWRQYTRLTPVELSAMPIRRQAQARIQRTCPSCELAMKWGEDPTQPVPRTGRHSMISTTDA